MDHRGFVAAGPSPADATRAAFDTFVLPVTVLAAAMLLIVYTPELPELLSPLRFYGLYFILGVGLLLSLAFKRGRALIAILTLLLADAAFRLFLADGPQGFTARTVYAALCVFVPVNLALLSTAWERGALSRYGAQWLSLLVLEIGATAAIVSGDYGALIEGVYRPLLASAGSGDLPVPPLGMIAMALALVVAVAHAVSLGGVIEAAFATAILAFATVASAVGTPDAHAWFITAGAIVTAGVLQDSYRMAFRDELTGLPGRRALNERLRGLTGDYTVAMLDVDHFKRFNDAWGHEVGDQALKLVASRLQRVGGGGTAYRYGGEEFAILFPGTRLFAALRHVEALREDIDRYVFEIRARRRRGPGSTGSAMPSEADASRWQSVAVSIGVAESKDRLVGAGEVVAAADAALLRAKKAGRNRVSR
jgi:diguanylate cyclase (GGDEF)-like protein